MPESKTLACNRCGTQVQQVQVRKDVFANPVGWSEVTIKQTRVRNAQLCEQCTRAANMLIFGSSRA